MALGEVRRALNHTNAIDVSPCDLIFEFWTVAFLKFAGIHRYSGIDSAIRASSLVSLRPQ